MRVEEAAEKAAGEAKAQLENALNPSGLPVYTGPTGAVRGVVTAVGDDPPRLDWVAEAVPAQGCPRALATYGALFRKGPGGQLADALVTATGYEGFIEAESAAVPVVIEGCAFDARTYVMTLGQHLEIANLDPHSYMPRLAGSPTPALRVAMTKGSPIPIFAPRAGRYQLVAETRPFMQAEVYVVRYPTARVTGLDGKFEIRGLPPGKVTLTAFSPALGLEGKVQKEVVVKAGATLEQSFELSFSRAKYQQEPVPTQPPAATQ